MCDGKRKRVEPRSAATEFKGVAHVDTVTWCNEQSIRSFTCMEISVSQISYKIVGPWSELRCIHVSTLVDDIVMGLFHL